MSTPQTQEFDSFPPCAVYSSPHIARKLRTNFPCFCSIAWLCAGVVWEIIESSPTVSVCLVFSIEWVEQTIKLKNTQKLGMEKFDSDNLYDKCCQTAVSHAKNTQAHTQYCAQCAYAAYNVLHYNENLCEIWCLRWKIEATTYESNGTCKNL